jgi:hypothetical protein
MKKGVINADEAAAIASAPRAEQRDRLAKLLVAKGVITSAEYDSMAQPAPAPALSVSTASAQGPAQVAALPAVLTTQEKTQPSPGPQINEKTAPPTFIPAVAPLRVLQLEPSKPGGLIPAIKLGGGAMIKPYGIIKASVIEDSSSPYGTDMPLPAFTGPATVDFAGPNGSPEFHVKARFARVGANFEWPDASPKVAITGKIEFDFEGNFTRVLNRNISTIRSSQASIRLAYGRVDYKATDRTSVFALFGQDWTPFGSSTLPNTLETTGLGLGFGTLYERDPQFRFGLMHDFGGESHFGIGPEVAIVLPAYGNDPANIADQLGFGERQGVDSNRPELQGRLVFQWQLDHAKGVAPAQIIFSGVHSNRTAIVQSTAIPDGPTGNINLFRNAFPAGATVSSERWGYDTELQLPTRYVTILAKYFRGGDLRWYFVNELFSNFSDKTGLTPTSIAAGVPAFASAPSIDGSSTVLFALNSAGVPVVVPQRPVRGQGGWIELGIPLSRVFNAEPASRAAGWTMNLHYSYDSAFASDARQAAPEGSRLRSDWSFGNVMYKLNPFVTFAYEFSYYHTRAFAGTRTPFLPIYLGRPADSWHDLRSEWATIFTF